MTERLLVNQALWAMTALDVPEASLTEKFDRVKSAGFDGMTIDLGVLTMTEAEATIPHFGRTGLGAGLTAFPNSVDTLRSALALAHRIGAPFVTVIGQDMPLRVAEMVPVIERWLAVAQEEGMPIQFETHRDCITNDLFTAIQLLEAVPAMRMAADLSHYVVDREMSCPPTAVQQALVTQVLERSDSFQGRIAARGQIQIALGFPQHAPWVALFRGWWREGFASWARRHAGSGDELVFLSELGPPDYAITDAIGRELSDRWSEAQQLKEWVREIWRDVATSTHDDTPRDGVPRR